MPPRRKTGLSADDRALWQRLTDGMRRLHPGQTALPPAPSAPRLPEKLPEAEPAPRFDLTPTKPLPRPSPTRGSVSIDLARHDPDPVGRPEAGLDRRTAEKLRRGRRDPDARIDLHGMTAERAHLALDRFIAASLAAGHRCVLVITGKGGRPRDPDDAPFFQPERGVLRQAVPRWLRSGPHAARIVNIYAAHRRHGGDGACYVYLKRSRRA